MKKLYIHYSPATSEFGFSLKPATGNTSALVMNYSRELFPLWIAGGPEYLLAGSLKQPELNLTQCFSYSISDLNGAQDIDIGIWQNDQMNPITDGMIFDQPTNRLYIIYAIWHEEEYGLRVRGIYLSPESAFPVLTYIREKARKTVLLFKLNVEDFHMKPFLFDTSNRGYDWDNPDNDRMKALYGLFATKDKFIAPAKMIRSDGTKAVKVMYNTAIELTKIIGNRSESPKGWFNSTAIPYESYFWVVNSDPNSPIRSYHIKDLELNLISKLKDDSEEEGTPDHFISV